MILARLRTIFATEKWRKLIPEDPMVFVENLREPTKARTFFRDLAIALWKRDLGSPGCGGAPWERPGSPRVRAAQAGFGAQTRVARRLRLAARPQIGGLRGEFLAVSSTTRCVVSLYWLAERATK